MALNRLQDRSVIDDGEGISTHSGGVAAPNTSQDSISAENARPPETGALHPDTDVSQLRCSRCGKAALRWGRDRVRTARKPGPWWELPVGLVIWTTGFAGLSVLLLFLFYGASENDGHGAEGLAVISALILAWVLAGVETVMHVWERRRGKKPRRSRDEYMAAARARRAVSKAWRSGKGADQKGFFVRLHQRSKPSSDWYLWCSACGRIDSRSG